MKSLVACIEAYYNYLYLFCIFVLAHSKDTERVSKKQKVSACVGGMPAPEERESSSSYEDVPLEPEAEAEVGGAAAPKAEAKKDSGLVELSEDSSEEESSATEGTPQEFETKEPEKVDKTPASDQEVEAWRRGREPEKSCRKNRGREPEKTKAREKTRGREPGETRGKIRGREPEKIRGREPEKSRACEAGKSRGREPDKGCGRDAEKGRGKSKSKSQGRRACPFCWQMVVDTQCGMEQHQYWSVPCNAWRKHGKGMPWDEALEAAENQKERRTARWNAASEPAAPKKEEKKKKKKTAGGGTATASTASKKKKVVKRKRASSSPDPRPAKRDKNPDPTSSGSEGDKDKAGRKGWAKVWHWVKI